MIGKLKDMTKSRDGKEWLVTFSTPENFTEAFDELYGHDIMVEIKKKHNKRSLDANAYCWVLIGQIAETMNLPKDEVYRKEIRDHGVYKVHCLRDSDVDESCEDWCSFGLGFQVEKFPSKIDGCTNVMFYKGSSYYDSKQMAKLIDGIVHEAEGLGIPTITEKQMDRMIDRWRSKNG